MYLHVLPHVPCSMCMFFSGGPMIIVLEYIDSRATNNEEALTGNLDVKAVITNSSIR